MPFDQVRFDRVCCKSREAMLLHSSADALEWDERTGMPIAGGRLSGQSGLTAPGMAHRIRTETLIGDDLQSLMEQAVDEDPASDQWPRFEVCSAIGIAIANCRPSWFSVLPKRPFEGTTKLGCGAQGGRLFNVSRRPLPRSSRSNERSVNDCAKEPIGRPMKP